jgi:DNA-binding Lrp family transcriptional regulator
MALSELAREFINRCQGGFALAGRPFARLATRLGTGEAELLSLIRRLLDEGYLSRFGPIYDASRLGGGQTLAALSVPEADFVRVAETVNALPEVAHNYQREHRLNMWFVVAAATPAALAGTLGEIARRTGLQVYDFPKQHEFYLGLWLHLSADGAVDTVPPPVSALSPPEALDAVDYRIVSATQGGLPLVSEPVEALAESLHLPAGEVLQRLERMLSTGAIRRIGAVPNHYRLGLRGNGMSVWDVPDGLAVELGERVGALDFVSHSYLRPRYPGVWPYNLFAMVHGVGRAEVLVKVERVAELLGEHCRARDVLFSTQVLKKTGLRLVA